MKLIFKPSKKRKQIKLRFFNTSSFPKRSQKEWKLIDRNPFGDTDKDGVPNFFDCKPLNKKKQGWAHTGVQFNRERSTHVKMMSPEKFLRTAYIESKLRGNNKTYEQYFNSVINQENVQKLKGVIQQPKGKMDVPFLEYDEQGNPTGHEGRHRATAAKEMGIKLIPVTIAQKLKEPRDWKTMRKTWKYKGTKHDWRNELENVNEVISSASAGIPIKEQREYGEEKPEAIQSVDKPIEIQEED